MKRIACLGEVMIELVSSASDEARIGVAGDTYNTAVYLKKLDKDNALDVSYVTALGTDTFSERILDQIKHHQIRADLIERREKLMPGLYAIETDEKGERSFSYWRGQSAAKTLFQHPCEIAPGQLTDCEMIYASGISMAILPVDTRNLFVDFLKEFRRQGGKFAFDSNYRPHLWEDVQTARATTMTMWSLADIALPSLDDEIALFDEKSEDAVLSRLQQAGVNYGALKRGAHGPLAIGGDQPKTAFEPVRKVVDTTAAGDSFNAGFLYRHMIGESLETACITGHQVACNVIQSKGAIVDIGSR